MILTSLSLKNFRIHKDTFLNFSENLNFIVGGNGKGKTSILESIYYLCTTKSPGSKNDSDSVKFNENEFEINGTLKGLSEDKVRIYFSSNENKKYYFQNNKQIGRTADVIGNFPVVFLTPADHSITQGSPSDRRKFVDSVISQSSETYLKILLDYNKTLRQRSSLLSRLREDRSRHLFDELFAWSAKLVQSGVELIKHRKKFIDEFNGYIAHSYKIIMGTDEIPGVTYSFLDDKAEANIEEHFFNLLKEKKEDELRRAANLVGPHRDDFVFELNKINLRNYGSQGQHKTFQVVLRFAQFFYLQNVTGKTPIFLLDDVFGELDANRSLKINEYLREVGQAFITLTDLANTSYLKISKKDKVITLNGNGMANA